MDPGVTGWLLHATSFGPIQYLTTASSGRDLVMMRSRLHSQQSASSSVDNVAVDDDGGSASRACHKHPSAAGKRIRRRDWALTKAARPCRSTCRAMKKLI